MAPSFSLQDPYVVATLPRPIDHTNGRYVAGEVYGGVQGSKKRKRAEVAIGIDGEGVNLYDIASSSLITSYALPPQSSFTCPPTSIRSRLSKSSSERRTYVSTTGTQPQIALFYESIEGPTSSTSSTATRNVERSSHPVVYLDTIKISQSNSEEENKLGLLVIKESGEVQCLDGDNLKEKWTSPATSLRHGATESSPDIKVEYAQLTNAYAASQGILKGRRDIFAIFPQEIAEDGFNPEILIIVTASESLKVRTMHVTSLPRRSTIISITQVRSLELLMSVDLPYYKVTTKGSFSLQPSAGTLQQLSGGVLHTFDLTDTIPKEVSAFSSRDNQSFLRLSSTSIMVSSGSSITVYNPKYQSTLATIEIGGSLKPESPKRKRGQMESSTHSHTCDLLAYFPKLGSAVAISDNNLIAIQVDGQQDKQGKSKAAGLLINSLGCSVKDSSRRGRPSQGRLVGLKTLESYLPASFELSKAQWSGMVAPIEKAVSENDVATFEKLISSRFGVQWLDDGQNGIDSMTDCKSPSDVDRRWIIYAISKIFKISEHSDTPRLSAAFYPANVFMWLLKTGNMTVANIETALRGSIPSSRPYQAGDLVDVLVELDPEMDLLLALLAKNFLEAAELLHALRRLMESLGLSGEEAAEKQALLTNGDEALESVDHEEELRRLEAQAEDDLAIAEYQLGAGSGVRGEALSLGLSKLYTCPTNAIVYALQTTYVTSEIVSLIYLLRFELARGAWTSRYLDDDESDIIDEDADIPNNAIVLISSLLNNCIDAIGAGGWISGDARLVNGDPFEAEELIASLKLEVSAALEGIEEAEYLKGLTSEMVRYGELALKAKPKAAKKGKPMTIPTGEQEKTLPLGLKVEKKVSLLRIAAGGEIQRRTMRDIGQLKSQKVGKYTLEKIVI